MGSRCENVTVFEYEWNQVAQAFWNRYPNPLSSHVLTEDTISREVRDGKLYTRRLLSKTNPVPKWGERFIKTRTVKIVEDSVMDPKTKTLRTFTRNIGLKKIMGVDETVVYTEDAAGKTIAKRSAFITSQLYGFSRAIRAFGVERFKSNCNKTAMGFNMVLQNMFPNHTPAIETLPSRIHKPELHQQQQQSRMERLKNATRAVYNFSKSQALKAAQMFSVRN